MYRFIILASLTMLVACSDNNEDTEIESTEIAENVFQTQIDAYDKAIETEKMLEDVMEKQRQIIEDNGG